MSNIISRKDEITTGCLQPFSNQRGQSAVEYIIIVSAIITALIGAPSVVDSLSTTLVAKYKSYSFAVSVSDLPTIEFDKKINENASKISEYTTKAKEFINFLTNPELTVPSITNDVLPQTLNTYKVSF